MSSWINVKLCSSSTAAATGAAARGSPPAAPAARPPPRAACACRDPRLVDLRPQIAPGVSEVISDHASEKGSAAIQRGQGIEECGFDERFDVEIGRLR